MAEFVNLVTDDSLNVTPYSPISIPNVTPGEQILDGRITPLELLGVPMEGIYEIELTPEILPEESEEFIGGSCDTSRVYGNQNEDGSFKLANLFSEIITDYQKAMARQNLGIADDYALLWGNIKGTIANQVDLQNLVIDTKNDLVTEINALLATWGYNISIAFDEKANINSPHLNGIPTTPTPEVTDNSEQIASTKWVTEKIGQVLDFNLSYFSLNTASMFYGDSPVNLVCSWEYNVEISAQSINGTPINILDRTYSISDVNNSTSITLSYVFEEHTYSRTITFQKLYPIYVGKAMSYTNLDKIKGTSFIVTCNTTENLYIYYPGETRIASDGLVGGFTQLGTILIWGITYYIYKTVNSGLGKLYITLL